MKTVYCIPKLDQIDKFIDFSREYHAGFEYNDFFLPAILDQPDKVEEIIQAYLALDRDRSEDTLHGVFLDICVNSSDSLIYQASDFRIHQSMDLATKLGVKAVIFHTNHISNFHLQSYQDGWVEQNKIYWKNLLAEYPNLSIYIENMFDEEPTLLKRLAEQMKEEPRFGVCLDVAHAFISKTPIWDWYQELGPYIRHLHINDNDQIQDSHHPVGSKKLPWNEYADSIHSIPPEKRPTVLIEVRTFEDLMKSVDYMQRNGLYPFCR